MSNSQKPVDDCITAIPGNWTFDDQVSEGFDTHVRKSIPFYDEVQQMIVQISESFIRDGSTIYDIGSSTGETLFRLAKKHETKKDAQFIGIEMSEAMMGQAKQKCAPYPSVQFFHQCADSTSSFTDGDYVMALYTLHFLKLEERARLLQKIHQDMNQGGALVFVDKILGQHPTLQELWNDMHWDFKKTAGLTDEMILEKSRSLRGILIPQTYDDNVAMLKAAGFTTIECFFKWLNFSGFIAIK